MSCLTNSQTSLATLVQQESERTRQHIDQVYKDDRFYQEVKKSLFYPNIFSRQEQVANEFDGIENSYEWIFDERSEVESEVDNKSKVSRKQPPWDNFSEWLRTGNAVYWINGKAGSGKSTLMNYICGHEKKTRSLKEWSSDRLLLTPTFFFWNAGVLQQKTIDGLLRSLIFQMLTECPELITCFKVGLTYMSSCLRALLTKFVERAVTCLDRKASLGYARRSVEADCDPAYSLSIH